MGDTKGDTRSLDYGSYNCLGFRVWEYIPSLGFRSSYL